MIRLSLYWKVSCQVVLPETSQTVAKSNSIEE